ncbi:MAG: GNAT family N-acetyltransferase [Hyphomicrobiales bacterium]
MADRDRPQWRVLFDGYLEFYKSELSDDVKQTTWERLLSGDPNMGGLVAAGPDDQPVGLAHYIIHPSTWTKGPYCYLEDLFVDPDLRGKGIGRALIADLRRHAEKSGCERLYWLTQEFNYPGRMLYDTVAEKIPFVVYEDLL